MVEYVAVILFGGRSSGGSRSGGSLLGSGSCGKLRVEVGGLGLLYSLRSDARCALDKVAGHEEYAEDAKHAHGTGKIPCGLFDEIVCAADAHHLIGTTEL